MKALLAVVLLAAACHAPAAATSSTLLYARPGGDGDSWHDTQGREYRLGLINTPELNECFGPEASRERKKLVRDGFTAEVYTHDRYQRGVSVVTLKDGTNLNVFLARHGFANARYLNDFRHENPSLGALLDPAFAAAKKERVGLWGACPNPG